jgi:outer membrane receptor protein involved in Fe transport
MSDAASGCRAQRSLPRRVWLLVVRRDAMIRALLCAIFVVMPSLALAQAPQLPPDVTNVTVIVVGTTPLPGVDVPADQLPAPVQSATSQDIDRSGALAVSDFLNRRMTSVHVTESQNNPFQPDVNYRGYTASPLLGTPQGLSVYMDGVRLNQPFGEVVSWDLIPRLAIASTTLMPGSNPVFGLNTLGGALSLQTKTGAQTRGTTVQATYGSDVRRMVEFEHGGVRQSNGLDWYLAGSLFGEDGWRDDSPSDVRQIFGKVDWRGLMLSLSHANNSLNGNGFQAVELLDRDYASVYTKPDTTDNRATLFNTTYKRNLSPKLTLTVNGYFRHIRTTTLNGDINEDSLDQSIYQPGAAERAALAAAGYTNIPASGLDASNTPFPSLRCIGNALLRDEPGETCNGLINHTNCTQKNGGISAQVTHRTLLARQLNLFTVGAAVDRSSTQFGQSSELGYVNSDRSVTGVGAFGDGITGGEVDGEPFDTRVDLHGTVSTWSVYATDTLPIGARTHVTLSGRYNRSTVHNVDRIHDSGDADSLTGNHVFDRFNPAVGLTVALTPAINVYGGYSEGSRAATSIELGCANPEVPCKLPNAMAGDPPLNQVVTRSLEAGVRGTAARVSWNAGLFRAANHDDILFVTSDQTGFGYFRNFGETRREGLELGARTGFGRVVVGGGYTYLRATFESPETLNGESNSTNDEGPGLEGTIDVEPGDRLPLVPAHLFKAYADIAVTRRLDVDFDLLAVGPSYARGNENNQHEPDGVYYLGEGKSGAYAVVNLGARVTVTPWLQAVGQIDNLFNRKYSTGAQLGPAGFTASGAFVARPFPAVNGEFPVRQTTFVAPGAPIRGWIGARVHF